MSKPFWANRRPSNVVHEDRDVQPLEPLRDPLKVDPGLARILQEILDVLNLSCPLRLGALDLLNDALEFLLVPSVQDEVESLVVKFLGGGSAYAITGASNDGIRRGALKIFLPTVRGSKEIEPHEIEDSPQFCDACDKTYVVDDVKHGKCRGVGGSLDTKRIQLVPGPDPLERLKVPGDAAPQRLQWWIVDATCVKIPQANADL